jgi:hypothetical protein
MGFILRAKNVTVKDARKTGTRTLRHIAKRTAKGAGLKN